jgi:hypothetical protein
MLKDVVFYGKDRRRCNPYVADEILKNLEGFSGEQKSGYPDKSGKVSSL